MASAAMGTDERWIWASPNPGLTLTWLNLGKNKLATVPAEAETTVESFSWNFKVQWKCDL